MFNINTQYIVKTQINLNTHAPQNINNFKQEYHYTKFCINVNRGNPFFRVRDSPAHDIPFGQESGLFRPPPYIIIGTYFSAQACTP